MDTPDGNVTGILQGWVIESIGPPRYGVRPGLKDWTFSEDGPKAWLVVSLRT
jgi:hypothetical protein